MVLDVKEQLELTLDVAKAVVQNLDEKSRKEEAVWVWLDKVKGVSYETVDVLQERRENKVSSSIVHPFFSKFRFWRNQETASKLRKIRAKLDSLLREAASRGYAHALVSYKDEDFEFESLDKDISPTCCRGKDKECVVGQLVQGTGVKVISIVGQGGIGKTTLAQCVYSDSDQVEKHFELRVWVSVSNCFDEERMARDMLLSIVEDKLKKKEAESNCSDRGKMMAWYILVDLEKYKSMRKKCSVAERKDILLKTVNTKEAESSFIEERRILVSIEEDGEQVFKLVEECFSGKVFLCVFDDVWTEYDSSRSRWMKFASLLKNGAPGSRILVTTRSEVVAQVVGSGPDSTHNLKPLSDEEWWELWRECLMLSDRNKISNKMFDKIGFKIKEKCGGLPLFTVALGHILVGADNTDVGWQGELNKWSGIGDKMMWEMEDEMKDAARKIFRHFYRTYSKLSPTLKLCILFCADFEKGSTIVVDKLIRMWMAQGYVSQGRYEESDDANKTLKGLSYFDELSSLGFFHKFQKGSMHKNKITSCELDDAFHDFIRYEARRDLAALDQDRYIAVRHKARERHFHVTSYSQVPENFCGSRWKGIKSLVLSSLQLGQLPDGIGCLSQLKYLDLSGNTFQELPETLCDLQSLQFLDVHDCYLLLSLPQNIKKLKQLKHLRVADTTDELHNRLPPGFEDLTLLLSLDVFRVGGTYKDTIQKLKGLAHLVDICITVHGLVNLSDADFGGKYSLKNLELCFQGEGSNQENASKSMKDLKPPPCLQMLKLDNYPLEELPSWILDHSLIKNLTRLALKSAPNLTSFPALWKLGALEFLWLSDISKLKHIGRDFLGLPDRMQLPDKMLDYKAKVDYIEVGDEEITVEGVAKPVVFCSLKTLRIDLMKNLEVWEDICEDEKIADITVLPALEELIIEECPKQLKSPLRILRDTPWFKITKSARGGIPENNAQPPSQTQKQCSSPPVREEKETAVEITELFPLPVTETSDPCMKLKALLEAYSHKCSKDYLEVAIPEGVLGKEEIKPCLSLEDLYRWLDLNTLQNQACWVFAEQLCIWSKLVYELMKPADKERVQMVSSGLITTVGRTPEQPDTRAEDLVSFMTNNEAKLYLVPYLRPAHWELLAIVPENRVIYRFDSLQQTIETELTQLLKMVERSCLPDSNELLDSNWRIVDIKHKKQTGDWECGYYVMIWMHKIAIDIQSVDLEPHFPLDESPYEADELKQLAQKWCQYVSSEVPN